VIYICKKNQQNEQFFYYLFNSIIVSSTCFEQPSVHLQEVLYMQLYGILSCICKLSGRCQGVFDYQIHSDIDMVLLTHCKLYQDPLLSDPYQFIMNVVPNIRRLILTCRERRKTS
jgi:hypothetical protein